MRWTRPLAALALTPVVAALLTAAPATGADRSGGGERYVAFGDSFVSGPGIAPARPGDCERSTRNFPSLVAAELGITKFTDASCGGARIGDLWAAQRDNPPQLDALTADTGLVTFGTLGGNDVGLVSRAASCLSPAGCPGTPDDQYHQSIDATLPTLVEGIQETKRRAPNALIAVIGYGTYLPPGGCPDNPALPGFTAAEADYVQGLIDHLSDVLAEAAAAEDVLFVDMRDIPGTLDHTVCAAPEDQWLRALNTYGDGAPLHPSAAGQAAMAGQVLKVLADHLPTEPPVGPLAVAATCRHGDLRVRVRADEHTSKVVFRLGSKRLGVDRSAPWVLERRAAGLARIPGRLTVAIVMHEPGSSLTLRTSVPRPRCLR